MKIFISYRYTGENRDTLKDIIDNLCLTFKKAGHEVFCSFYNNYFYKENNFSYKQILDHALTELDNSDCVFALIKSEEKSEGMLLELGYAYSKNKKIILAIKSNVKTVFLREIAEKVIEFDEIDNLYKKLEKSVL